jgi:YHS domain-containing protein
MHEQEGTMRIHCDVCGEEIEKEDAVERETDEGEVVYFCSEACAAEMGFHETMHDPDVDEDASDVR